jgi:hypothetical protein
VLFADDTSIIIASTNAEEYKHNIKLAITEISNWFENNLLTVNYNKTYFCYEVPCTHKALTCTLIALLIDC